MDKNDIGWGLFFLALVVCALVFAGYVIMVALGPRM